jgi:hypothetical protein
MNDPGSDRRAAERVVRSTLRVTLVGADYEKLGDLDVVNASASGLLIAGGGQSPLPAAEGSRVEGVIWDAERPGNVPFKASCVRVEPHDGPVQRMALQISWIDPGSYMTYQQLVYR